MPDDHPTASDFADAEQAARAAEMAAIEANEDGPAPIERPTAADNDADDRDSRARHALAAPRFMGLGDDEIDLWLEKHGALAILVALSKLERKELAGQRVEYPIAYIEKILTSKGSSHRKGRSHDEPSVTKPARESEKAERLARMRQGYAADFDAYKAHRASRDPEKRAAFPEYASAADYAEACLHAHRLAHEIAAMDDCPERDALVARYRQLP